MTWQGIVLNGQQKPALTTRVRAFPGVELTVLPSTIRGTDTPVLRLAVRMTLLSVPYFICSIIK